MVDFRKRLTERKPERIIDPVALYDTLDRVSDKGPLRPAQKAVLGRWYAEYADKRDVILKMHTGVGKTLVGLLMLQSKLNAGQGPALYLCPNQYLVSQTCEQAKQFGLSVCTAEEGLPVDFTDAKSVLVASVQKLFNGLTQFGLGNRAQEVGAIVVDDAHASVDAIRNAFVITLKKDDSAYTAIRDLFADELAKQGAGTFEDIQHGEHNAYLPVPYWAWQDRASEVVRILSGRSDSKAVRFTWPLIRDTFETCQCVVSGRHLEIAPYLPPLHLFRSYADATLRVFMSATVADDSFLVKGLEIEPDVISTPLAYEDEKWSGEKMIVIPSLIDDSLDRDRIIRWGAKTTKGRPNGLVVLTPSFKRSRAWEANGATIAQRDTIDAEIASLRKGDRDKALVIVNRYDGIDLPDDTCRVLIFDSEPYSESLVDLYTESCRRGSETTAIRKARTIEQGLGRSVRGERDYCIIVIIGSAFVKFVRAQNARRYLSNQTQLQIQIGLDTADMVREDLEDGAEPFKALIAVMRQCLRRDDGWKAFYAERMEAVEPERASETGLAMFSRELRAEQLYQQGEPEKAVEAIQSLIDEHVSDDQERGWYLQEMARYALAFDRSQANKLQRDAHLKNHALLKPRSGMQIQRIVVVSQKRMEQALTWITQHESYEELHLAVEEVLGHLTFGIKADTFEEAFNQLGHFLGFGAQRPEREWKEGPDNLWGLREGEYLLAECKSEVSLDRVDISAREVEQMNRSCAWFASKYEGATCHPWIIIPTRKRTRKAAFTHDVTALGSFALHKLVTNVRKVVAELKGVDFGDLSERKLQQLLDGHHLSVKVICSEYTKSIFPGGR